MALTSGKKEQPSSESCAGVHSSYLWSSVMLSVLIHKFDNTLTLWRSTEAYMETKHQQHDLVLHFSTKINTYCN